MTISDTIDAVNKATQDLKEDNIRLQQKMHDISVIVRAMYEQQKQQGGMARHD